MRSRHSGNPFAESPADIAAALTDLSVPALLLSCIHTAPPDRRRAILDGPLRPAGSMLNEFQGFMSDSTPRS